MRRILLGGFGIVLGAFAPPALAQQPTGSPPPRAAAFGKPVAVPDTEPADSAITPAGLLRPGVARPTVTYPPGNFGAPTPVIAQPPGMFMPPPGGMPMVQPIQSGNPAPPPRLVPGSGQPMVMETRDPTGRIPTGVVVPSVGAEGFFPEMEAPLFAPRAGLGLDRLRGCGRNWISAEYLMWWNRSTHVPALATTSSQQFNGIVGQGDTQVLLGGTFGDTFHSGGRVGVGHWFDDNECRGIEGRLFWVAPSAATFTASSPPIALLARPFLNVNPSVMTPNLGLGQSAEVVAGPSVATGTVTATMRSTVWGAEANYRRFLAGGGASRLDILLGYRYLDVREDLTITESFTRVPGSDLTIGIPAQMGVVSDRFRTENHFHGGQIGFAGTIQRGRWSLEGRTTVAFGTVFQSAEINGSQMLTFPDGSMQVAQGGLLAVPDANIGRWTQNRFAVVPEIGMNVGYQLTNRMKVFVGYNFLYLSSAVRPGDVIDQSLDAARVPNLLPVGASTPVVPIRPMPVLNTSGYFVQGINFGLVYKW